MNIPLENLIPNPAQPRKAFNESELQSLADSLRINGQLQAVVVTPGENGQYIVIAGERRLRAAKIAGLKTLRADVLEASNDQDRLILALIENIQRLDMQPVEEARGYKALLDMGLSINAIAHRIGRSAIHITNRLKLLDLDGEIQDLVNAGLLPVDQRSTTALLSVTDPDLRVKLAQKLARPGQNIKTVQQACENLKLTLAAKHLGETPSLRMAAIAERHTENKPPRWDALKSLGTVPPWPAVTEAARATCGDCPLRETASDKTCRECPAVEILRYLIRRGQE